MSELKAIHASTFDEVEAISAMRCKLAHESIKEDA